MPSSKTFRSDQCPGWHWPASESANWWEKVKGQESHRHLLPICWAQSRKSPCGLVASFNNLVVAYPDFTQYAQAKALYIACPSIQVGTNFMKILLHILYYSYGDLQWPYENIKWSTRVQIPKTQIVCIRLLPQPDVVLHFFPETAYSA